MPADRADPLADGPAIDATASNAGGGEVDGSDGAPHKLKFFGRPSFGGAVFALVFWWRSLYPTLLPRSWLIQAAITAICVASPCPTSAPSVTSARPMRPSIGALMAA